jgi:predicted dehydrogenase
MLPAKVGVVGCGKISGIYFKNMCGLFDNLEVVACADLDMARAEASAAEFSGVEAVSVDELIGDAAIDIVVNLTVPKAHYEVSMRAVEAGKSVYAEKPMTLTREEGRTLLEAAKAGSVLVGNAPDTFLGAGLQTCRQLMDEGAIGAPVGAVAFMLCRGHERWHPDPEFYYEVGGGPVFDMGPYYLTALVSLLGSVTRVTGVARKTFPERTITSEKKKGKIIPVDIPTHVAGVMDFESGPIGTMLMSFDVWAHALPRIEIYGTEGSMNVPDPNGFGGPIQVKRAGSAVWEDVPVERAYGENTRGLGVADMACALQSGRAHRANGDLAYHVLDIMHAVHEASDRGQHIALESRCDRPAPLPENLQQGELDA